MRVLNPAKVSGLILFSRQINKTVKWHRHCNQIAICRIKHFLSLIKILIYPKEDILCPQFKGKYFRFTALSSSMLANKDVKWVRSSMTTTYVTCCHNEQSLSSFQSSCYNKPYAPGRAKNMSQTSWLAAFAESCTWFTASSIIIIHQLLLCVVCVVYQKYLYIYLYKTYMSDLHRI